MRFWLSIIILLGLTAATDAGSSIVGVTGNSFGFSGRWPLAGGIGSGTPAPTGDILLVDGVSLILQTDGASFICLAGGC